MESDRELLTRSYRASSPTLLGRIAVLTFVYPATWVIAQLGTGALSDRLGRKGLIAGGMLLQRVALAAMVTASGFRWWVAKA